MAQDPTLHCQSVGNVRAIPESGDERTETKESVARSEDSCSTITYPGSRDTWQLKNLPCWEIETKESAPCLKTRGSYPAGRQGQRSQAPGLKTGSSTRAYPESKDTWRVRSSPHIGAKSCNNGQTDLVKWSLWMVQWGICIPAVLCKILYRLSQRLVRKNKNAQKNQRFH
jgi:hypothetical protein